MRWRRPLLPLFCDVCLPMVLAASLVGGIFLAQRLAVDFSTLEMPLAVKPFAHARKHGMPLVAYTPGAALEELFDSAVVPPSSYSLDRDAMAFWHWPVVHFSFRRTGLGSNLMVLATALVFSALSRNHSLVIVSSRLNKSDLVLWPEKMWGPACQLQLVWQRVSSFPVLGTTMRENATAACDLHRRAMVGPEFFAETQQRNVYTFHAYFKFAFIAITRLKPEYFARLALKNPSAEQLKQSNAFAMFVVRLALGGCRAFVVLTPRGSHIRRTDKRDNHYRYRNASAFILAGLSSRVVPGHIYLCSDDKHALSEFKQNWTAITPLPLPPVTFRLTKERPDYPRSFYTWDKREETYLDVLADVQLFALAKVFVGPQSSNMGRMACLLRDYVGCYNVEAAAERGWKCARCAFCAKR